MNNRLLFKFIVLKNLIKYYKAKARFYLLNVISSFCLCT